MQDEERAEDFASEKRFEPIQIRYDNGRLEFVNTREAALRVFMENDNVEKISWCNGPEDRLVIRRLETHTKFGLIAHIYSMHDVIIKAAKLEG